MSIVGAAIVGAGIGLTNMVLKYSKNEYEHVNKQIDVMNAILKLKEKYRIVILLFYYDELSVKEMAAVLAEKEATVLTRLKRAREKLGDILTMFEKE